VTRNDERVCGPLKNEAAFLLPWGIRSVSSPFNMTLSPFLMHICAMELDSFRLIGDLSPYKKRPVLSLISRAPPLPPEDLFFPTPFPF